MAARGREIAHWTVAFYGCPRGLVEGLFFSPGYRHCIAFAWLDTDRWLELDPRLPRQEMRVLTGPQYSRRMRALERIGARVVKATPRGGSRHLPRIATCAGTIAHVLGVRGALRPEELYRALAPDPKRGDRGPHAQG